MRKVTKNRYRKQFQGLVRGTICDIIGGPEYRKINRVHESDIIWIFTSFVLGGNFHLFENDEKSDDLTVSNIKDLGQQVLRLVKEHKLVFLSSDTFSCEIPSTISVLGKETNIPEFLYLSEAINRYNRYSQSKCQDFVWPVTLITSDAYYRSLIRYDDRRFNFTFADLFSGYRYILMHKQEATIEEAIAYIMRDTYESILAEQSVKRAERNWGLAKIKEEEAKELEKQAAKKLKPDTRVFGGCLNCGKEFYGEVNGFVPQCPGCAGNIQLKQDWVLT